VQNHIEKAKLAHPSSTKDFAKKALFLSKAKADLVRSTRNDRLALLSDPDEYDRRSPLSKKDMSPRYAVPSDYRLSLDRKQGNLYRIFLEHRLIEGGRWVYVSDIEEHFKEHPKVESLLNITQAIRCAVVAFEGNPLLYQTSSGSMSTIPRVITLATMKFASNYGRLAAMVTFREMKYCLSWIANWLLPV